MTNLYITIDVNVFKNLIIPFYFKLTVLNKLESHYQASSMLVHDGNQTQAVGPHITTITLRVVLERRAASLKEL